MHSRIFQVSSEPITEENLINESRYYDGFVGSAGIDYVVESESVKDDLDWLGHREGIEIKEDNGVFTLTIVSKKAFFEKQFEEFKELAEKVSNYSMEEFIDAKNWLDFYRLKDAYEDTHGFHIDDNGEYFGITTLDDFMRNAEEGKTYYIGKTFDYHF